MRILNFESFRKAKEKLEEKNQFQIIKNSLNDEKLILEQHNHTDSKKLILNYFLEEGWAYHPQIFPGKPSYLDLLSNKTLLHVQFGHNAQIYYNFLAASSMYHNNQIDVGVVVVPGGEYSYGNRVNFDKITDQYQYFSSFLLLPILIVEVE